MKSWIMFQKLSSNKRAKCLLAVLSETFSESTELWKSLAAFTFSFLGLKQPKYPLQ